MEVFLVWGTTTTTKDVSRIAELVKAIEPDKVQLNTAVRPPCEEYSNDAAANVQANEADILEMLKRRPCTLDQICRVFGLHKNEASKYLGKLTRTGQAREHRKDGEMYFSGVHDKEAKHANV